MQAPSGSQPVTGAFVGSASRIFCVAFKCKRLITWSKVRALALSLPAEPVLAGTTLSGIGVIYIT